MWLYYRLECKIITNLKTKQDTMKNFHAYGRLCQIPPRYFGGVSAFFSATLVEKS